MTRETSAAIEIGSTNGVSGENGPLDMGSPAHMQSFVNIGSQAIANLNINNGHQGPVHEEDECSTPCKATASHIDLLPGEQIEPMPQEHQFVGCRLVLTNYRLCIVSSDELSITVVSVMDIESLDLKDLANLAIICKNGKVFRITAVTSDTAFNWHRRLMKCTTRASIAEAFAWKFSQAVASSSCDWLTSTEESVKEKDLCQREWDRFSFDPDHFTIYDGNKDHRIIETYPERLIVPKKMSNDDLDSAKDFRFLQRFPVVVWKSSENRSGAVLLRSSQPRCGLFSWRNSADEKILQCVLDYMTSYVPEGCDDKPKICIMDARSYAAAWANRAKGGGFESCEYYPGSEAVFLGLPNIHNVRYAFVQLRSMLTAVGGIDQATYLQNLQTCNWLHYLNSLLTSAKGCVDTLFSGTCVLVHCSDGWDRTAQIVSLAKLMADEYYRTIEGFEELIRREWIEFGHKFADRNGMCGTDSNERSPVFVQWLDAVWQIMRQNQTAFQFNYQYLIKLAQHVYSGLFGTFLFNSQSDEQKELRKNKGVPPVSIWRFLGVDNDEIRCYQYDPKRTSGRLDIRVGIQYMEVWKECYLTDYPSEPVMQSTIDSSPVLIRATAATSPPREASTLQKSKSSESMNSLGNPNDNTTLCSGSLNSAHSESNGRLNISSTEMYHSSGIGHMENSIMTDSVLHRTGVRRSVTSRSKRRQMLDPDGLARFIDPVQQQSRRIYMENERERRRCEAELAKLRQRSLSEKTSASESSRDAVGRMRSVGEDSEIDQLDRAPSDMSLVDHSDVVPAPRGWQTQQDQCHLCKKQFNMLALKQEDRPHHCRNCGHCVCESCSPHSFHDTMDGKGHQRRACVDCYNKMAAGKGAPEEREEEDIPSSSDHNGDADSSDERVDNRPRKDALMHQNGSSPSTFHNGCSPSQAVKG